MLNVINVFWRKFGQSEIPTKIWEAYTRVTRPYNHSAMIIIALMSCFTNFTFNHGLLLQSYRPILRDLKNLSEFLTKKLYIIEHRGEYHDEKTREKLHLVKSLFIFNWNFSPCFYAERMFPLSLRGNIRSNVFHEIHPSSWWVWENISFLHCSNRSVIWINPDQCSML